MPAQTVPHSSSPPQLGHPIRWGLLLALVCALTTGSVILAQSGTVYDLSWNVVPSGGYWGSGSNYQVHFSFGQPSTVGLSSGANYGVGQGFWLGDNSPTAVKLTSFAAAPSGPNILVTWETATEHDNVGFHLYRQGGPQDKPTRLNAKLIPSRAPGGDQGARYAFLDDTAQDGVAYLYTLEDVDSHGRATPHGPVAATAPYALFLPLLRR